VGLIAGLLVNVLVYFFTFGKVMALSSYFAEYDARWFFALIVVVLIAMTVTQIFVRPIKGGIFSLSATLFGVIYIVLFFSHIIMIRSLTNGFIYLLILHVIVMINDTFAYFGGVFFGRHKTGLMVSPNKSWEGYFSGILFSMIAVIVVNEFFSIFYSLHLFGTIEAAFVGIFFSLAGDLGDLVESAVKRDGKVKDSGRLIPGHGGMWDVFDALVLSLPLFYYYLKLKGVQ
jgi:phosphatidate cytidylyltransferase